MLSCLTLIFVASLKAENDIVVPSSFNVISLVTDVVIFVPVKASVNIFIAVPLALFKLPVYEPVRPCTIIKSFRM